ncbi:MAG: glycoside hydrolase family 1 protein [Anaerolineae bacterium]|nr:glycoside hydrolase family 1 protein [Anaerolineae bacterium]
MQTHLDSLCFPSSFRWGTATSSHQVEGHQYNNNWWAAEKAGGFVYQDQQSGAACDWWNRAEEDFDRMAALGLNAHRMSIEWSRVQPAPDRWDDDALARYQEMVDALLERDIEPMITLHHFTEPLWMTAQGSWENDESVGWFEKYVHRVVTLLSDKVTLWCTINEPMVLVGQAYLAGIWPPGQKSLRSSIDVGLNLTKAHAAAYHTIHGINPSAQVGLAKHMVSWSPHRVWIPTDHLVARMVNRITNHLILDAAATGRARLPFGKTYHIKQAANTLDWLGINYYQRYRVGIKIRNFLRTFFPSLPANIFYQGTKPGYQKGPGSWGEIHPEGLFDTLRAVAHYGRPIYITENGIPDRDDKNRPRFIITHLHQLWRAIEEAIPVKGYYHWSLVDNFEWAEGYNPDFRFGLFGVDIETQERTPRPSSRVYGEICRSNSLTQDLVARYDPELVPQIFRVDASKEPQQTEAT